jgi:hypothetical protein
LREAARTVPAFSPTARSPALLSGGWAAVNLKVSKVAALAACRFLSRARAINTHPDLVANRERIGGTPEADAATLAAEAAIAAGTLQRRRVTAAEATPLPAGVFATTGRALRFLSNSVGFKGVRRTHRGEYMAELFDGPHRYNLGCFDTPEAAAEAYDRASIRVRPDAQSLQLNFPPERYAQEVALKRERGTAAADEAEPVLCADAGVCMQLCAAGVENEEAEEAAAAAAAAPMQEVLGRSALL